jgi:hypothetical protein
MSSTRAPSCSARDRQHGEDAQIGEARYRRQRSDQPVIARDAGRRQPVAQAAAVEHFQRGCAERRRLLAEIGWTAGGDDLAHGVDDDRFEIVREAVGPAEILEIAGFDGGEGDAGEFAFGIVDAARQRIGVAPRVAPDVGAVGGGSLPGLESDEIGAVADVDARRREIGRNISLQTIAIEDDQIAQLGQRLRVALREIIPAAARFPAFPVALVFGKFGRNLAQQDIDRLEAARGVFADHDAEIPHPLFADLQFAVAGEQEAAEEGGDRADQHDNQYHEVRAAADHPGKG